MDVGHSVKTVTPTLDGPVLEVLARTTARLTSGEVHRLARTGSRNGVRQALARLSHQGLVLAETHGRTIVYEANRDHVAWPAVEALAGLRRSLVNRLVEEVESWEIAPIHASLLGSAIRGDGDADSDIDILLIRPDHVDEDQPSWADQVDRLRRLVPLWTGNHCHPFQLDTARLAERVRARDPLVEEWRREAVGVTGDELRVVL